MSNKVPQIRFNGYSDAWVQRKVGDFLTESRIPGTNGAISKKLTVKLWGKGVVPKETVTDGSEATKYYVRKTGQFMYGKLDFLHAAFGIVPESLDGYESTLDSPAFDIVNVNSTFLMDTVMRKSFYLYQGNIANGSRKAKRIHVDTFLDMPIDIPTLGEQDKIGAFFDQLDNLIAANQRKLDLLKEQKKGYLQKMFPKNGAKVPELRFAGFADDWEERKLSDMANVKTGFPFKNENFVDDGQYLVITNGNIQNDSAFVDGKVGNRITAVTDEIKEKYTLNYGDILVTMDGTVGRTAKVVEGNQILAQRVGRLVSESTPEFIYQWLNTGKFFTEMTKVSHGGTIKHISLSEIGDYVAYVPTSKDEREKIGSLFLNIDKTITLHQRKLDLLKEQKKGFLQKMFV